MAWMESSSDARVVSVTKIGDIQISTVFLGLDHNFGTRPPHVPILFETLVFNGYTSGYQTRYATFEAAAQGHEWIVREVKADEAAITHWYERLRDIGIV